MLKFHRKVNPKEGLIGFYKTGKVIDEPTVHIYRYYQELVSDSKNKGLLSQPLLFLIDPTMSDNRLTIKVRPTLNDFVLMACHKLLVSSLMNFVAYTHFTVRWLFAALKVKLSTL